MSILRYKDVDLLRRTPNKSVLLFITDRCPVGCKHCSVDSKIDSLTISDKHIFEIILKGICNIHSLECVGISGGEPFTEKWGLTKAVEHIHAASKKIVLYTSGVWGKTTNTPKWIKNVLSKTSCVFLSTDAFHQQKITDSQFIRSLHALYESGTWIVVQVVDTGKSVDNAKTLLSSALGQNWIDRAELNIVSPLLYGRGINVFSKPNQNYEATSFGCCSLLNSPTIRYDGVISTCCNEAVLMGFGPNKLRDKVSKHGDVENILNNFANDSFNQLLRDIGIKNILMLPPFHGLSSSFINKRFNSICEICWIMQEYIKDHPLEDRWRLVVDYLKDKGKDRQ